MALAIVPASHQDPVVAIKPYCGATRVAVLSGPIEEADATEVSRAISTKAADATTCEVYKAPVPAWADLGIVHHMQEAVVPEEAMPDAGVKHLKVKFQAGRCIFRFSVVILSLFENILCYLAYLQVAPPEDSFYNKFEAHLLGFPGLEVVLLVFSIFNSCYLLAFWMMIAFIRLDLYSSLATGRLLFSLPTGGICVAMVFFGEGTKIFPFLCAICVLLHFFVWIMRHSRNLAWDPEQAWRPLLYRVLAGFIIMWLICFIVMFAVESADYLYDSECPATTNKAMPVRIKGVHEWQCVKWHQPHYIRRTPAPGHAIHSALCSTSFHAFNTLVNASTGEQEPSSGAHMVRCPSHCQDLGLGDSVIGCEVYSATSSICSAAVQMGILVANAGGIVKVVGRAPPVLSSGKYTRCNRNGILSSDTPILASDTTPDWAFYFQVAGLESLDMVTLHGWSKTGTPGASEPWKSYVADVTWVVGGESQRREVVLGPGGEDAEIELNFCRGSASCV